MTYFHKICDRGGTRATEEPIRFWCNTVFYYYYYYYYLILGRYIPEEGKKLMKKIGVWSSTNPGGRKTKNRRAKAPR